jgi:hypothetical protein
VERVAPVVPPTRTEEPETPRVEEPVSGLEPIDRLSAFESMEKGADEVAESAAAFGRHRRPFTARRTARQVKPPETKNHQQLGENGSERSMEKPPEEPAKRRSSLGGRIGMPDGIGPVDFDQPEEEDEA